MKVFCDVNSMLLEEMELKAWDQNNEDLHIKIERDKPNRKKFKIFFRESIDQNEETTYSFSYIWKKMFPSNEEYFKIRKTSADTSIRMHFPKTWFIQFIIAEPDHDNEDKHPIALVKKSSSVDNSFRVEEYTFKEVDLYSSIIITWKRK